MWGSDRSNTFVPYPHLAHLYPPLVLVAVKQYVGGGDEVEANIEHRLAREGLKEVMSMLTVPGFGAAVEVARVASPTTSKRRKANCFRPSRTRWTATPG